MARARHPKYGAIPTKYQSVTFRSRLEARWAAAFDLLGIRWEYESLELKGYIPDFLVNLNGRPVLLECKPAVSPAEFRAPIQKINRSGWLGPAIILGNNLFLDDDDEVDVTARGCRQVGTHPWLSIGRSRWPAEWGDNPFEDIFSIWREAGNVVMWKSPT